MEVYSKTYIWVISMQSPELGCDKEWHWYWKLCKTSAAEDKTPPRSLHHRRMNVRTDGGDELCIIARSNDALAMMNHITTGSYARPTVMYTSSPPKDTPNQWTQRTHRK
jgi:hypothetical protein